MEYTFRLGVHIKEMRGTVISVLFSYVLLGGSLSAPVGPINVAQINKGIKKRIFKRMACRGRCDVS